MAYAKTVDVMCDGEGCGAAVTIPCEHRVEEVRKQARSEGWLCRDGQDYCPDCRPKRGEQRE
jgi:hypothetical protein